MVDFQSPDGCPHSFSVGIADAGGPARQVTVLGKAGTEARCYDVAGTGQNDWLDFFERLARDFGTRLPRNRKAPPAFEPAPHWEVLLSENLTPDLLYGYGDPAVLRVEEAAGPSFYLAATSNDAPHAFPILRSADLRQWELVRFAFLAGQWPRWVAEGAEIADCWAPELHRIGDRYLLCFAARELSGDLAIGIAHGVSPAGPFIAADEPLLGGGVIDPHIFTGTGGPLLLWKEDSNGIWPRLLASLLARAPDLIETLFDLEADRATASFAATLWPWIDTLPPMEQFALLQPLIEASVDCFASLRSRLERLERGRFGADADAIARAMRTPVFAQKLSEDGTRLLGERHVLLVNDLHWEGHLIEGMWLTEQEGLIYLF